MKKIKLWSKRLTAIALSASMAFGTPSAVFADVLDEDSTVTEDLQEEVSVVKKARSVSVPTCSDAKSLYI